MALQPELINLFRNDLRNSGKPWNKMKGTLFSNIFLKDEAFIVHQS